MRKPCLLMAVRCSVLVEAGGILCGCGGVQVRYRFRKVGSRHSYSFFEAGVRFRGRESLMVSSQVYSAAQRMTHG